MFLFGGKKKNNRRRARRNKLENNRADEDNRLVEIESYSSSIKGTGTKKMENQDALIIVENHGPESYFLAVFDGHGSLGKEGILLNFLIFVFLLFLASSGASEFFQEYFLDKDSKKLAKLQTNFDREKFLKSAFKHTEKELTKNGMDYSVR